MKILIPIQLQKLTDGLPEIEIIGGNVNNVLVKLISLYPNLENRIFDDKGELNKFINFYVNDEDIRFLNGIGTPVDDNDVLSLIPAIAGG